MDDLLPNEFYLSQNYPNPFNEKTTIKYCVPYKSPIKITILDSDMKILRELENGVKEPGTYEVEFSIKNGNHTESNIQNLQTGTYYYMLETTGFNKIKEMVLADK